MCHRRLLRTQRRGHGATRGNVQNAGSVPIALRPDDHVRIAIERNGVGARLDLKDHLGIGEVGKSDLAVVAEGFGAEMRPEVHQPVLRVAIDLLEPLALDVIEACLHQLERYARASELMANGETLDLGEFAEKPYAKATRRLLPHEPDEMRRDQI